MGVTDGSLFGRALPTAIYAASGPHGSHPNVGPGQQGRGADGEEGQTAAGEKEGGGVAIASGGGGGDGEGRDGANGGGTAAAQGVCTVCLGVLQVVDDGAGGGVGMLSDKASECTDLVV